MEELVFRCKYEICDVLISDNYFDKSKFLPNTMVIKKATGICYLDINKSQLRIEKWPYTQDIFFEEPEKYYSLSNDDRSKLFSDFNNAFGKIINGSKLENYNISKENVFELFPIDIEIGDRRNTVVRLLNSPKCKVTFLEKIPYYNYCVTFEKIYTPKKSLQLELDLFGE